MAAFRSPSRPRLSRALLLLALAAAPAAAQYRAAGSDIAILPDRKSELETAMQQAPWHLGGLRVAPWIGVRDVSYVRELDAGGRQRPADLTATGGAGLRAYLPLGTHTIVAAHALPEYAWWQKEKDRNAVVGHYGLGLFSWGTRVQGELTARRVEEVAFLSSDVLVNEPIRDDEAAGSAQVRLFGSIGAYLAGTQVRTRVDATSGLTALDPAQALDRDTTQTRLGLRYLLRGDRGHLGAGALEERTKFLGANATRSNKGSSWYAESLLHGNHLDLSLQYDSRDLQPDGSAFPGYRAGNGQASLVLHPGWRVQYQLYGRRQLRYSALDLGSYLEESRSGAGLHFAVGKGGVQLFYETGDDDYFGTTPRHESVTARGGWLDIAIRRLNLRVGGRLTRFTPDGGGTREVREVIGALSLSFGQPGEW